MGGLLLLQIQAMAHVNWKVQMVSPAPVSVGDQGSKDMGPGLRLGSVGMSNMSETWQRKTLFYTLGNHEPNLVALRLGWERRGERTRVTATLSILRAHDTLTWSSTSEITHTRTPVFPD